MIFLNDKGGEIAKYSAASGHKALVYHKSHDAEENGIDFYENGGIAAYHGEPLDEFLMTAEQQLLPDEVCEIFFCSAGRGSPARKQMVEEVEASSLYTGGHCTPIMYIP